MSLEGYTEVKDRIPIFIEKYESPRIITELLSDPNKVMEVAVVKAFAYDGETLLATGLAFEKPGNDGANKTAHLENCETSAIGRALANMNILGGEDGEDVPRASATEMGKPERMGATTNTEEDFF